MYSKNKIFNKKSVSIVAKNKNEIISTKNENQIYSKTSNSFTTSINNNNNNNKIEFKSKDENELSFDEIFPDYNEILSNNYYQQKYLKNNYINLGKKVLDLKIYFKQSLPKEDFPKYIITDKEDKSDNNDALLLKKKTQIFIYYKRLLSKAKISEKNIYLKKIRKRYRSESDILKKKSLDFFEEDIVGEEIINLEEKSNSDNNSIKLKNKKKHSIKNKISDKSEDKINNIYVHKKKKSLISSYISDDKNSKSKSSFITSSKKKSISKESGSSLFLSSNDDNNKKYEYTFIRFFWRYLNQREFCLVSLYNREKNVGFFIRITTFIFMLFFLFVINALLLTSNQIHKRYIYIKNNGSINEFKYIFQKEIGICFLCTFLYLIIKMLFIKFIYGKLFNISFSDKKNLENFEDYNSEEETERKRKNKNKKMKKFIKKYKIKIWIYFCIIFIIMIAFGYVSINYCGIFNNTGVALIIRFFIAFIFSIIICIILCFIISVIYHFGKTKKNKCLMKTYKALKIIY